MGKYSKNSKTAGLIIAIAVFASLLLFSVLFNFSVTVKIWLVNVFTAITIGTIVYFILHLTKAKESIKLLAGGVAAALILFFNPGTLTPDQTKLDEVVEEIPDEAQEEVDTIYQDIEDNN